MILLDIKDMNVDGPDNEGKYTVSYGPISMFFYPSQFKNKTTMEATGFIADALTRMIEKNKIEVASELLTSKMSGLLQEPNKTAANITPRQAIENMSVGHSMSVNDFVALFFKNPYGPSESRRAILEMKEEGFLDLDNIGMMTRCDRFKK
jgi:hypothetical protein